MEFANIEELARAANSIFSVCTEDNHWRDFDRSRPETNFRTFCSSELRGMHNKRWYVMGPNPETGWAFSRGIQPEDIPAIIAVWRKELAH